MVARSEKLSAGDLCACMHWRGDHSFTGECTRSRATYGSTALVPCMCREFRMAVHPAELTKGAKS